MVKKDSQTSFRPYYVNECEDTKFTIKQIASQFNKDPDTLDFILQAITTYKKIFMITLQNHSKKMKSMSF